MKGHSKLRPKAIIGGGIGLLLLTAAVPSSAQTKDCQPKGYEELVKCAVSQSSEIQISEQQLKAANNLEGIASQWRNPELEAESVQKGSDKSETTAALLFDIRLGGKRGAAIQEAQGEFQKAKAGRDLNSSQAKLELILKFYRLNHLKHEIKIEEESVSTFSKIIGQYRGKAALSPEQEVSLSVFRMATSDHQLNLVKLRNEQEQLLQELSASTNISRETIQKNLPDHKVNWPEVSTQSKVESSPHMRFAEGELIAAKGQKEKADADAWPDLKVGPAVKIQKDGGSSENYFGLSLSMPLPIFSLNGSGRAYGAQKLVEAEMSRSLTGRKIIGMREQLVKKYQATVSTLKASITDKSAEEKHERVERHFFRGLVPSSLVIEAHRQLIELEEKRNESERDALEALGSILIIDNQFSEVIL
ncbi:MAG: TolC family protein [Bdellovibrionales bacterium]|nr:TolC family protein [Bdellovibrionales bacterium]